MWLVRKIIFYDKVGIRIDETHRHLLTLDYYILEVQALVDALDLASSGYHIFGDSWGTTIAMMSSIPGSGWGTSKYQRVHGCPVGPFEVEQGNPAQCHARPDEGSGESRVF